MKKEKRPLPAAAEDAGYESHTQVSYRSLGAQQPPTFPVCELHGVRVVMGFPDSCPLREGNPLDAIRRYKDAGFEQLDEQNWHEGETLLRIADTCGACVGRLTRHPHVKCLRNKLKAGIHA